MPNAVPNTPSKVKQGTDQERSLPFQETFRLYDTLWMDIEFYRETADRAFLEHVDAFSKPSPLLIVSFISLANRIIKGTIPLTPGVVQYAFPI